MDKAIEIVKSRLELNTCDIQYDLPIDLYKEIVELKKELLAWALEESYGNKTLAAKLLNMNRSTFMTLLADFEKNKPVKNKRISFFKKS